MCLLYTVTALAAASLSGCGSSTSTVTGAVTYQGQTLTSGSVILYCADKQIVRGLIASDGTYTIPNVPCGPATVTVQAHTRVPTGLGLKQQLPVAVGGPIPPGFEPPERQPISIPSRYGLPEESGLSIEVDSRTLTYDIVLKP
jgi:hypothetical protein